MPGHFFRAYFVDTGELRLLDEEFPIDQLAEELLFVHARLELMDRDGGRFRVVNRET